MRCHEAEPDTAVDRTEEPDDDEEEKKNGCSGEPGALLLTRSERGGRAVVWVAPVGMVPSSVDGVGRRAAAPRGPFVVVVVVVLIAASEAAKERLAVGELNGDICGERPAAAAPPPPSPYSSRVPWVVVEGRGRMGEKKVPLLVGGRAVVILGVSRGEWPA